MGGKKQVIKFGEIFAGKILMRKSNFEDTLLNIHMLSNKK
jgi:hypothetical protein